MRSKSLFLCFLVAAIVSAPMAEAQLGLISGLLGLISIKGQLFCTVNGDMGVNGTATPVFPNALVRLQCRGTVVSTTTTDGSGLFSILLNSIQFLLTSLLNNCNLAVATPLSSCDATLPSVGGLLSLLQLNGTTLQGLLNISNIIPAGFKLQANI